MVTRLLLMLAAVGLLGGTGRMAQAATPALPQVTPGNLPGNSQMTPAQAAQMQQIMNLRALQMRGHRHAPQSYPPQIINGSPSPVANPLLEPVPSSSKSSTRSAAVEKRVEARKAAEEKRRKAREAAAKKKLEKNAKAKKPIKEKEKAPAEDDKT